MQTVIQTVSASLDAKRVPNRSALTRPWPSPHGDGAVRSDRVVARQEWPVGVHRVGGDDPVERIARPGLAEGSIDDGKGLIADAQPQLRRQALHDVVAADLQAAELVQVLQVQRDNREMSRSDVSMWCCAAGLRELSCGM